MNNRYVLAQCILLLLLWLLLLFYVPCGSDGVANDRPHFPDHQKKLVTSLEFFELKWS